MADFSPTNIERLLTVRDVARQCGQKLVILSKDDYLLESIHLVMPEIPDPINDATLVIYREVKDAVKWDEELLTRYNKHDKTVRPEDIRRNEGGFILCFNLSPVGVPDAGTGKVFEPERGMHSSLHASASGLLEIINMINPRVIILIHTEYPRLFNDKLGAQRRCTVPKLGVQIQLPIQADTFS